MARISDRKTIAHALADELTKKTADQWVAYDQKKGSDWSQWSIKRVDDGVVFYVSNHDIGGTVRVHLDYDASTGKGRTRAYVCEDKRRSLTFTPKDVSAFKRTASRLLKLLDTGAMVEIERIRNAKRDAKERAAEAESFVSRLKRLANTCVRRSAQSQNAHHVDVGGKLSFTVDERGSIRLNNHNQLTKDDMIRIAEALA